MKKVLSWFLTNGIFAACTYYGLVENVEGAYNVGVFIIWVMFTISAILARYMDDAVKNAKSDILIPIWIDRLFDLVMILVWVWYGHQFFAALYLFHVFPIAEFQKRVNKKFQEEA